MANIKRAHGGVVTTRVLPMLEKNLAGFTSTYTTDSLPGTPCLCCHKVHVGTTACHVLQWTDDVNKTMAAGLMTPLTPASPDGRGLSPQTPSWNRGTSAKRTRNAASPGRSTYLHDMRRQTCWGSGSHLGTLAMLAEDEELGNEELVTKPVKPLKTRQSNVTKKEQPKGKLSRLNSTQKPSTVKLVSSTPSHSTHSSGSSTGPHLHGMSNSNKLLNVMTIDDALQYQREWLLKRPGTRTSAPPCSPHLRQVISRTDQNTSRDDHILTRTDQYSALTQTHMSLPPDPQLQQRVSTIQQERQSSSSLVSSGSSTPRRHHVNTLMQRAMDTAIHSRDLVENPTRPGIQRYPVSSTVSPTKPESKRFRRMNETLHSIVERDHLPDVRMQRTLQQHPAPQMMSARTPSIHINHIQDSSTVRADRPGKPFLHMVMNLDKNNT